MISEETAQRIAAALERLAQAIEQRPMVPAPFVPIAPHDPYRCMYCGAHHGGGACPHLKPTAMS
jgi:hypothetical protein